MAESQSKNSWPAEEEKILAAWQKKKIFGKTLKRTAPKGNFVFYEGPPTANAAPGVHHVLARVFKDIIVRFRTMQGYHVERKAGWDTHGLPVELQVEKKLGLKSKPEIETYGIAKFNAECRELVWKFKDEWEKLTERIGFWLDLKNPYITYENDYIESVWAVIAKANQRKLLYQGHKVVPFCTRCGTALSSHEVAQGYESVTEDSVYIKCRVTKGNQFVKPGDFILTWTTTPWTLPGNVALAVGKNLPYMKARVVAESPEAPHLKKGETYIFAAVDGADKRVLGISAVHPAGVGSRATFGSQGQFDEIQDCKGSDLVGVTYEPLFSLPALQHDRSHRVYPADFVTTTDGTGVVHTAVMYGEDDYQLGESVGLPKQHTVGLDGKFLPHVNGLAGKYVKASETQSAIYDHLNKTGAFFRRVPYTHDYPFCWRCHTPLLYYAKDSWFIAMTKIKDELLKNAAAINWVPTHIKEGRFGEWLENLKDWAISRERYWGTPMPVWQCQTGKEDKRQKSRLRQGFGGQAKVKNKEGCGHWPVVGSVAELKKLTGKTPKDLHRPFIDGITFPCTECGGTMQRVPEVLDVWLDSGSMPFAQYHYPFENKQLIDGGVSITKSKKTYNLQATTYKLDVQYPADYICEAIDQTRGWFYTLLAVSTIMGKSASYKNVICLGHINDIKGQKMSKSQGNIVNPWDVINRFGTDPLRWYFYTINQPGEAKNFDPKQIEEITKKVFLILQNVVSFYRLYTPKSQAVATPPKTSHVLDQWVVSRLHLLTNTMTKSLEQCGVIEAARPMAEFITDLSTWYVRRSRERFKADDRQATATFGYVLLEAAKLLAPFTPFFAEWVYRQVGGKRASVHLEDWPTAGAVDQNVLASMSQARDVVTAGLAQRMAAGLKIRQPLASVTGPKLGEAVQGIVKDELNVVEYRLGNTVQLDTQLTPALKLAGVAREFIRTVNALRKDAGLTIHDTIAITYEGGLDDVIAAHRQEILHKTKAETITAGQGSAPAGINGQMIKLKIEKVT